MRSFDLSDIVRAIPGVVLARAQRYVHQGRVRGIEPGDETGTLVGRVQGTERRPYEQHIRIVGDARPTRIIGRCSCPVGTNCKHVAAVLLAALDQPDIVPNGHGGDTALIEPVFVYKLRTLGTVEEKISELQASKRGLADGLFENGEKAASSLTAEDIASLFAPIDG